MTTGLQILKWHLRHFKITNLATDVFTIANSHKVDSLISKYCDWYFSGLRGFFSWEINISDCYFFPL